MPAYAHCIPPTETLLMLSAHVQFLKILICIFAVIFHTDYVSIFLETLPCETGQKISPIFFAVGRLIYVNFSAFCIRKITLVYLMILLLFFTMWYDFFIVYAIPHISMLWCTLEIWLLNITPSIAPARLGAIALTNKLCRIQNEQYNYLYFSNLAYHISQYMVFSLAP